MCDLITLHPPARRRPGRLPPDQEQALLTQLASALTLGPPAPHTPPMPGAPAPAGNGAAPSAAGSGSGIGAAHAALGGGGGSASGAARAASGGGRGPQGGPGPARPPAQPPLSAPLWLLSPGGLHSVLWACAVLHFRDPCLLQVGTRGGALGQAEGEGGVRAASRASGSVRLVGPVASMPSGASGAVVLPPLALSGASGASGDSRADGSSRGSRASGASAAGRASGASRDNTVSRFPLPAMTCSQGREPLSPERLPPPLQTLS